MDSLGQRRLVIRPIDTATGPFKIPLRSTKQLTSAGEFTLAVLASDQRKLARACATPAATDDRQRVCLSLRKLEGGVWHVPGAIACTACRVRKQIDLGDHTVFLADILTGVVDSRRIHLRQLLLSDL